MSTDLYDRISQTVAMIREDMEQDIRELECAPFDGRTVAEMFGKVAAAVSACAGMIAALADAQSRQAPPRPAWCQTHGGNLCDCIEEGTA